ncbi:MULTISPECIES: hypothetical protein [unclassified Nocardioides]|uniref:hypothetical protein n=1 Tax=unclassified Nocardioides TaxID=2615069 RepID=UPI0036219C4A
MSMATGARKALRRRRVPRAVRLAPPAAQALVLGVLALQVQPAPKDEVRVEPPTSRAASASAGASLVEQLLARHHCWTGPAPGGAPPRHALVSRDGQRPALHPADVGFGIWLDGMPGVLHAFCP